MVSSTSANQCTDHNGDAASSRSCAASVPLSAFKFSDVSYHRPVCSDEDAMLPCSSKFDPSTFNMEMHVSGNYLFITPNHGYSDPMNAALLFSLSVTPI